MAQRESGAVAIEPREEGPGVRVSDPIERCQYDVQTPRPVAPVPTDCETFPAPVDAAVAVETSALTLPRMGHGYVRTTDGDPVLEVEPGTERTIPDGRYDVELNAPVKLYLRVPGPFTVSAGLDRLDLSFRGVANVQIGARSYHRHPAATVTTTASPSDCFRAISHLSSSLKTTSCERSFPTLRGHPPLLAVGDRLDVPEDVTPPETGVRLELPADLSAGLVAAPLAYYLGATVVAGDCPRLVTDEGFEHSLDGPAGFERAVERTLVRCFLLDCCTRTEGHYRVDLHERAVIEDAVDLDFATLYDRPLSHQLRAYLSVPSETVVDVLPTWGFTAHLPERPASIETLPFVADELGVVRLADARPLDEDAVRGAIFGPRDSTEVVRASRGSRSADPGDDGLPTLVDLEPTGAIEEAWFGEHAPVRGSKSTVTAFRNALERTPKEGPIDVTVVCNGEGVAEARDVVEDVYGSREELEFAVDRYHDLSRSAMREVLADNTDFLHYVGHIDADGIPCSDGSLDVTSLQSVGVDAFLLNGCRSYDQGMALIEAGSVGGVVTIADVVDGGAVTVGVAVARLLNLGFPLRSALSVARETSVVGGHYLVVGNGHVAIAQLAYGSPMISDVETGPDDAYTLTIEAYLSADGGMGSMVYPALPSNDRHYLYPGTIGPMTVSPAELRHFLGWQAYPIRIDGELYWRDGEDNIEDVL